MIKLSAILHSIRPSYPKFEAGSVNWVAACTVHVSFCAAANFCCAIAHWRSTWLWWNMNKGSKAAKLNLPEIEMIIIITARLLRSSCCILPGAGSNVLRAVIGSNSHQEKLRISADFRRCRKLICEDHRGRFPLTRQIRAISAVRSFEARYFAMSSRQCPAHPSKTTHEY